jgi:hypothetical protein
MGRIRRTLIDLLSLVLVVSTLSLISVPSANAYSISNTDEVITTTGGGGYITANCDTGSIIRTLGATGEASAVLTRPYADCFSLNSQATTATTATNTIGGNAWGGAGTIGLTAQSCSASQGVVGLVVHKQNGSGYVSGWQLICGDLPTSSNRTTSEIVFGWTNPGVSSPSQRETISCPTGMFAVGMSGYVGSILDKIGFKCGTISGASQTITFANPGTKVFGSGNFSVSPTSSSGLSVTTTSATPSICTIASTTV